MAEPVIVPVQAKIIDVDTSAMNVDDMSKEISKSMTGIKKAINDAFSGINPSAINKPIDRAMVSVKKSVQAAENAYAKYNQALMHAASTTEKYKKDVSAIDAEIDSLHKQLAEYANVTPKAYAQIEKEFQKHIDALKAKKGSLNPAEYIDSASPIELEKVALAYKKVLAAQEEVNKRSVNFNTVAHDNRFSDEYQEANNELAKLEQKLAALQAKSAEMHILGASKKDFAAVADKSKQLAYQITTLTNYMITLVEQGKAFRFGDGNEDAEIDEIYRKTLALVNELNKLRSGANMAQGGLTALGETHPRLAAILTTAGKIGTTFGKVTSAIGKVASAVKRVASAFGRVVKGIANGISKMLSFGKAGSSTSNDLMSKFKKLGKNIFIFALGFRTVYSLIKRFRTIFMDSYKLMGENFEEFSTPLKELIASFSELKGSLAAAFQPIVSVLMPILTQAMNKLTGMLESIGKFNAYLTGQGYVYKAIAKDINSVATAAKKAENLLGSYDKLDMIQDRDTNDGIGDTNNQLGYEYVRETIGSPISDLAQMVKGAWEIADFSSVGKYISDKLIATLSIVEATVVPKVTDVVNRILNAINTFIAGFDAKGIGESFGGIINAIVTGLDWKQLGSAFANLSNVMWDFTSGLVNSIDWSTLGTKLLEGVKSLFGTLDVNKLTSIINGLVSGIGDVFNTVAPTLISLIGSTITSAVSSINWENIGSLLMSAVDTLFNSLGTAMANSGVPVVDAIGNAFLTLPDLLQNVLKLLPSVFSILDLLAPLLDIVKELVPVITNILSPLLDFLVPLLKSVLTFLAPVIQLVASVLTVLTPVFDLLNVVLPLIDTVFGLVTALLEPIIALIAPLVEIISNIITPIIYLLEPIIDVIEILINLIGAVLVPILEVLAPILQLISSIFTLLEFPIIRIATVLNMLISIVQFLANIIIADLSVALERIRVVIEVIINVIKIVVDAFALVEGVFTAMLLNLDKAFTNVLNKGIAGVESFANAVIKAINFVIKAMNSLSFDVPDWVPLIGGKKFGFNVREIREVKIPRLAQGAVIPPNQEFLAMLGDQKHGTNIEAPLDTIKQALAEVLAEVGGGNREPIVLQVNGRTLAKVVWDEQEKRYKQTGKYSPA